jgi:acyl carrier protein
MTKKTDQFEEQFSVRIPTELANNVRKTARKTYGDKAGAIKKFVISAFENEIEKSKIQDKSVSEE